jgi:hypothetical protein
MTLVRPNAFCFLFLAGSQRYEVVARIVILIFHPPEQDAVVTRAVWMWIQPCNFTMWIRPRNFTMGAFQLRHCKPLTCGWVDDAEDIP